MLSTILWINFFCTLVIKIDRENFFCKSLHSFMDFNSAFLYKLLWWKRANQKCTRSKVATGDHMVMSPYLSKFSIKLGGEKKTIMFSIKIHQVWSCICGIPNSNVLTGQHHDCIITDGCKRYSTLSSLYFSHSNNHCSTLLETKSDTISKCFWFWMQLFI